MNQKWTKNEKIMEEESTKDGRRMNKEWTKNERMEEQMNQRMEAWMNERMMDLTNNGTNKRMKELTKD